MSARSADFALTSGPGTAWPVVGAQSVLEDWLLCDQAPAHPLSPLPPQPARTVRLQSCPEQLPSCRRRLLEAGPKVSRSPPPHAVPPVPVAVGHLSPRPLLEETQTCPVMFWGHSSGMEGDRGNGLVRERGSLWRTFTFGSSQGRPWEAWGGGRVEGQCVYPLSFPRVPYLAVARTFEKIEEVSAR